MVNMQWILKGFLPIKPLPIDFHYGKRLKWRSRLMHQLPWAKWSQTHQIMLAELLCWWKRMVAIDFVEITCLWICRCNMIHFLCPWLRMFELNWASHSGFLHWTYNQGFGRLKWLKKTSTSLPWLPNLVCLIGLSCL